MFEQRMQRPQSDQFYFQLEPRTLFITKPETLKTLKNAHSTFTLKLMKGLNLCDETKKPTPEVSVDRNVIFEKTQLAFYLPSYSPDRPIEFKLILFRNDKGKQEKQVSKYAIKSGDFIQLYQRQKTKRFQETVDLNYQYQLKFDLYIDKSRIQLEKYIRFNQSKENKSHQKEGKKENQIKQPANKNKKSERWSSNRKDSVSTSNKSNFVSPIRKADRKQVNEKRRWKKYGSPQRSQKTSSIRKSQRSKQPKFTRTASSKSSMPFISKHEKKLILAEKQVKMQKQAQRMAQQDQQQLGKNSQKANLIEKNPNNALTKMIKANKKRIDTDTENIFMDGTENVKNPKIFYQKKEQPDFIIKKTTSQLLNAKNCENEQRFQQQTTNKQIKRHNIYTRDHPSFQSQSSSMVKIISMTIFLSISCLILYLVMFPSRKF